MTKSDRFLIDILREIQDTKMHGMFQDFTTDSVFDPEVHKDNFVCYLEALILPDGTVKYAIPSHQACLFKLAGIDHTQIPADKRYDSFNYLLEKTGAIAVWYDYYLGNPNKLQAEQLSRLKSYGIYGGSL